MRKLDSVFVSGYTQAPKGTKLFEVGSTLGVMFEVDRMSHRIVRAECTFVTTIAQDFFSRLLIGFRLDTEIDEIIKSIEGNLFIPSAQSIIVAVKITHQRYMDNVIKKNK